MTLKFPNILGHFTLRVTTRFRNFQFSSLQIANHFWPDNLQPEEKRNRGVNLCHPFTGSNDPICLINEPGAQEYFGAEGWRKYIGVCYWYQVQTKHHPRYWSKASQSQIYSNWTTSLAITSDITRVPSKKGLLFKFHLSICLFVKEVSLKHWGFSTCLAPGAAAAFTMERCHGRWPRQIQDATFSATDDCSGVDGAWPQGRPQGQLPWQCVCRY